MGKTTLLKELNRVFDYAVQPEAGRLIIQQQVAKGGQALPWKDKKEFAEAMFKLSLDNYKVWAMHSQVILFDRGIPDILGYLRLSRLPIEKKYMDAARALCYNSTVFITPPWKEIFSQDDERKQSWEIAIQTYQVMLDIYAELGYHLIEIPSGSPGTRATFVHNILQNGLSLRDNFGQHPDTE